MISQAFIISSFVVYLLSENLKDDLASFLVSPIFINTFDGSKEPLKQATP